MKKIVLAIAILCIACNSQKQEAVTRRSIKTPIYFCHLHDISLSNKLKYADSATARIIYLSIAFSGGGTIRLWTVRSEGQEQEAFTLNVPSCDTIETSTISNVYRRGQALAKNRRTMADFLAKAEKDIALYTSILNTPREEKFSDVNTGLKLCAASLNQENWSSHRKLMVTTTDLIHSQKENASAKLEPVHISNTKILVIRAMIPDEEIKQLFPDSKVCILTDASDIAAFINPSQN